MPQRIQLSRRKGWRKPENTITVARPSRWGNPFAVTAAEDANYDQPQRAAVAHYRAWIEQHGQYPDTITTGSRTFDRTWVRDHLAELAGHDLACWCPLDSPCHADVLLDIANGGASRAQGVESISDIRDYALRLIEADYRVATGGQMVMGDDMEDGVKQAVGVLHRAGMLAPPVTDELRIRVARAIDEVDGGASSVEPCGDATYEDMADAAISASREAKND